jgi:hypothetical protein
MDSSENYMKKIEELQRNYFSSNNKNILFKKKQKLDCATNISKSIDLEQVLNMTFYNIGNTNIIYIDYTIFKTYAHPEIYETIAIKLINTIQNCIKKYGSFEIYVNLESITVSAFERYKKVLEIFWKITNEENIDISSYLNICIVLNSPSVIDTLKVLMNPFFSKKSKEVCRYYSKEESIEIIKKLFSYI